MSASVVMSTFSLKLKKKIKVNSQQKLINKIPSNLMLHCIKSPFVVRKKFFKSSGRMHMFFCQTKRETFDVHSIIMRKNG